MSELISEDGTVERVNEYKYLLSRHSFCNKLTFECNTNNTVKKCHQRMFCMFGLRCFGVSPKTLHMFYCSCLVR